MSNSESVRVWSVPCYDFIDDNGNKVKVTAIIAPIRITRKGDVVEISYACNRALSCKNSFCRYSKAGNSKSFKNLDF